MDVFELIFAVVVVGLLLEISYNIKAINNNLISLISFLRKSTKKEEGK